MKLGGPRVRRKRFRPPQGDASAAPRRFQSVQGGTRRTQALSKESAAQITSDYGRDVFTHIGTGGLSGGERLRIRMAARPCGQGGEQRKI